MHEKIGHGPVQSCLVHLMKCARSRPFPLVEVTLRVTTININTINFRLGNNIFNFLREGKLTIIFAITIKRLNLVLSDHV